MTAIRIFTPSQQQWIVTAWTRGEPRQRMAWQLRCSERTLGREIHRLGLKPRRTKAPPVRAGDLTAKRTYNKAQSVDGDGEKVNPLPGVVLFACPGCGHRAASPDGHPHCGQAA